MAKEWYYQRGGEVYGPFDADELRGRATAGELRANTLVRQGAEGQWYAASQVRGLLPAKAADAVPEVRMACWYCGAHRPSSVPYCGACGASWQRGAAPPQAAVQQQAAARRIDGRAIAGLLFLIIAGVAVIVSAVREGSPLRMLGGLALLVTAVAALCTAAARRSNPQQTGGVADHVRTGIGYLGYVAMQAALVMAIASVAMGVLVVSAIIALFSICTGAFNAP